jgi:hypothetical protein
MTGIAYVLWFGGVAWALWRLRTDEPYVVWQVDRVTGASIECRLSGNLQVNNT